MLCKTLCYERLSPNSLHLMYKVPLQGVSVTPLGTWQKPNTIWKLSNGMHWLKVYLRRSQALLFVCTPTWMMEVCQCRHFNFDLRLWTSIKDDQLCLFLCRSINHSDLWRCYCNITSIPLFCIQHAHHTITIHVRIWGVADCLTFILQKLASIFSCSTSFLAWPTLIVLFTGVSPFILATNTAKHLSFMDVKFILYFCFRMLDFDL